MKKLFLLLTLVVSVACEKVERVSSYDPSKDAEQDRRLTDLEQRVKELGVTFNSNVATINALSALVSVLDSAQYQDQIDSINLQIDSLEDQSILIQAQVANLSTNENVIEYIDPCGDNPGAFDEVILKTGTGKFLAYFQTRGDRFLTVLSNGSYETTDAQECHFQVNGSTLSW